MSIPNTTHRRIFILQVACAGSALAAGRAFAADPVSNEKLTETDAYAKSMGFRLDTTKVDQAKYPRHTAEQKCSVCQLFSGAPGRRMGAVLLLRRPAGQQGRLVPQLQGEEGSLTALPTRRSAARRRP